MCKNCTTFFVLTLLYLCGTFSAISQPLRVDFRQAANNDSPNSLGDVHWVQSILQRNNSMYYEGMSVPQRVLLTNIPSARGNQHTLTFNHKATKNGIHAYDFLTSYTQAVAAANAIVGPTVLEYLNECGASIGPPSALQATCESMRASGFSFAVDIPDAMGTALGHSVASSVAGYENRFQNRQLKMYGDESITGAELTFDGYMTSGSDLTAQYTLRWTSSSNSILVEFAGHLALGNDVSGAGSGVGYGSGFGAGSISGGSYHIMLEKLDGNALGSQDNQIAGATVLIGITCNSTGPDPVCMGTQNTYTFQSPATGLIYAWSLSNNTSGASIVGSTTGASVVVEAGNHPGGYTLTVVVRDAVQTVSCPTNVTVNGFTVTAVPQPLLCAGNKTPVTVAASGGVAPYSGMGTFLVHAGTHTFTVTDSRGCSSTATVTITEPPQLNASSSAAPLNCSNGTVPVTVGATGGRPPYNGTGVFHRGAGTHTFTVTDANNCVALTSITLNAPSAMNVTANAPAILCYGGNTTVTVTATGGTPPYTGTGTFTRSAGTYTFTVTDANGCTESATVTISQPASALIASASAAPILCFGGSSTVTVSATGGTPPYTGTGTFSRSAGTYTFTVTDANGCSATSTAITITQPAAAMTVTASATPILCYGGSSAVTVTASGGTPPYSGTGTFSRTAGTYTFTVTDANGCSASSSPIHITEPAAALAVNANATPISCFGGNSTVTVTASGGTPPYTGTGTFSRTAGTYTFSVTDANGCTAASAPLVITQPSAALAVVVNAPPILCFGGTSDVVVSATGGTPPYTGTGTFARTAGTYTFSVTDANGCTAVSASITITQPQSGVSVAVTATPILCNGGTAIVTVTASGGTPPYSGTGTFNRTAGTYTFNVTDANGCTAVSSPITINEPANALAVSASAPPISCYGGNTTVTVTASGGTPPYTGTGTFTRGAGTYTFTVTDANGCTAASNPITITQPAAALIASASATPILCFGGSSTVTVSATGGTPPYTGTGTFSRSAGTYTFTVTDASGCSATTPVVNITQPAAALTVAANAGTILCNGGTATVTVTASGGTPPYTGTGTFHRAAGAYTFTVTDANGCTGTSGLITLTEPPQIAVTASAPPILCNGGSTTVTVTATGGTPPYSGTGNFTVGAGTYTFMVTDANGCSASSAATTLPEPARLVIAVNAPPVLCHGGTSIVTVSATGGTPPYTGTGTFTRGAGTYTFTVTDANGCVASSGAITITQPLAALAVDAIASDILCNGGSSTVTVTATGGTPPYVGTGNYSRTAGTYTFTVTDANGCVAVSAPITISEPPVLVVSATALPILCNGGSTTVTVTATGGTPPYAGTGTFLRTAGTYTFTVTDANGCSATSSAMALTEPAQLVVDVNTPPILCNGGTSNVTVSASGGTPPYTGTGTFNLGPGTYTFTVTDANGCTAVSSVISLTEPPLLTAAASATPILCNGDNSIVTVTATGGTPPYTGVGTFVRGAGTYSFVVTDANGCTATTSVMITQPPMLVASASAPPVVCGRDSSTVTVTATGGTPPYIGIGMFKRGLGTHTFVVTDARGCVDSVQVSVTGPPPLFAAANSTPVLCHGDISTITVTAWGGNPPYSGIGTFYRGAGTYTFMVTDASNCTDTVVVTIIEPPLLVASVDAPPIACNGGVTTVTVSATGGTPQYTGTGTFTRGPGTHTFIVTDANGCMDSVTITLDDPPVLTAASSATPILCNGDLSIVTVTASGGVPPYTGTGNFAVYAGTWTFMVTDARGCTANTTITISEPPKLAAHANAPAVVCGRDSAAIIINATGGTPPYIGTGTFYRNSGTYTFVVTDANGCTDTVDVTVAGPPPLFAAAGATPILCNGGTSLVTVSAWGGTPPYYGLGTFTVHAGTYTFVVSDANNCTDTVTITILEPPPLTLICQMSECINGTRTLSAIVTGGTPTYTYYWLPFGATTPTVDVPCSFYGTVTLRVRDSHWSLNDPNNAACEAWCTINIYAKEGGRASDAPAQSINDYALFENYPNPFNPSTTIGYYVPEASHVRLSIYNTLGREITTLVDAEVPAGMHNATWNVTAEHGAQVPSGSYIYRIHATSKEGDREFVQERLMLLLK
jgi:hypothetical protein